MSSNRPARCWATIRPEPIGVTPYKIAKEISSYDEDARATLDYLSALQGCTGRMGVMGICIGGHLAFGPP